MLGYHYHGVIQGFVLCPLLFLICINYIAQTLLDGIILAQDKVLIVKLEHKHTDDIASAYSANKIKHILKTLWFFGMIQKVKKAPFNKFIKCNFTRATINLQHLYGSNYKSSSKENIRTTYLLSSSSWDMHFTLLRS